MNTTTTYTDPYPFEDFAPTLSQCFVIVIVGYLMAKFEILSASDVKGVISFASYFAMPGIICISLADADFNDFRWELLCGIFLGKLLTFIAVAVFLILLHGNMGVAGTVALFCVQSNDLPVGNPLMSSLYKNYRPQMMKYLFLIPAMTVILLVPISNIMVSMYRERRKRSNQDEDPATKKHLWQYICQKQHLNQIDGILKNPVVIATVLGLIMNFVFPGKVPPSLHKPIQVAAATIPGIALAMLGFSFVRKERYLLSSAVIPATVIFILKMVITPILLHSILKELTVESKSSKLLSDFALLYGIISPATAVFQSGQEFRKSLAVMSVALVLTSFSCFPVSYVVARITIAPVHKLNTYVPLLKECLFWTACISIFCGVFVWMRVIWKNLYRQVSSLYITYLVLTQVITCCGLLFWSLTGLETWSNYYQLALYYGGEIAGYLWTGALAVVLISKEKYSMLEEKGFTILAFTVFSISALITTATCLLMPYTDSQLVYVVGLTRDNFEFVQLMISTMLLFISLVVVGSCLLYHFKEKKLAKEITEVCGYENTIFYIQEQEEATKDCNRKEHSCFEKMPEKLDECIESQLYYEEIVKRSEFESNPSSGGREWSFKTSSLLILLELIMIMRFITNLFKFSHSSALEIMIPMEFLQSILFIGQGVFIMLTFGVDVRTSIITMRKWWRKMRYGADEVLANYENNNTKSDVTEFCNQFYKFYYYRCFKDIAKERRWKGIIYKDSFWGHQMVDWMITEGLCQDDTDAEGHGQKLLTGGVIQHVTRRHHFYDAPYLYHFVRKK